MNSAFFDIEVKVDKEDALKKEIIRHELYPLLVAYISHRDYDMIFKMLRLGADLEVRDNKGRSLIHLAIL